MKPLLHSPLRVPLRFSANSAYRFSYSDCESPAARTSEPRMPLFPRRSNPARAPQAIPSPAPGSAAEALEPRIHQLGRELLDKARAHRSGLLSARFSSDKLMEWSMCYPAFKVQLFRFVDAFPMLKTPEAIHEHLLDYLTQPGVKLP